MTKSELIQRLAERNPLLLQITADVTGRPVGAARVPEASAVGAAIYAAAAVEQARDMTGVIRRMGDTGRTVYRPDHRAGDIYEGLYQDYVETARGFGAFSVKRRGARMGRNPRTGESVQVGEKHIPFFKTGKELRERLNDRA